MRTNRRPLVLALLLLTACNSDKPTSDDKLEAQGGVSARAGGSVQALTAKPELGGNLLALGEYQVELAIQADGLVRALVFDARGGRAEKPEAFTLSLSFRTPEGKKLDLALAWNAAQSCFWGKALAQGGLGLKPIDVSLRAGGQVFAATLSEYALLPEPRFAGQMIAVGGFGVELVSSPGLVSGYVLDSSGKTVTRQDLELKLSLGARPELALGWDVPSASYRAAIDGALDASREPLRLVLAADGKLHIGSTRALRAIADLRAAAAARWGNVSAPAGAARLEADARARAAAKPVADINARATLDTKAKPGTKAKAMAKAAPPALKVEATTSTAAPTGEAGVKARGKASFSFGGK
jgi:hypothetical protein